VTTEPLRFFDLAAFAATPLASEPFPYLIVPGFMPRPALDAVAADYPRIAKAGSFPVSELRFGAAFGAMLEELEDRRCAMPSPPSSRWISAIARPW